MAPELRRGTVLVPVLSVHSGGASPGPSRLGTHRARGGGMDSRRAGSPRCRRRRSTARALWTGAPEPPLSAPTPPTPRPARPADPAPRPPPSPLPPWPAPPPPSDHNPWRSRGGSRRIVTFPDPTQRSRVVLGGERSFLPCGGRRGSVDVHTVAGDGALHESFPNTGAHCHLRVSPVLHITYHLDR